MPWAVNDGVRIAYEVEGAGPPLVVHVGFLGSLEDWRLPGSSYVDVLKRTHRVILLDPRGQGRSDKPHDPLAYAMEQRTGDVIAVLDALAIERSAFWGYSLGGRVGFELAARYPDRLTALVAGGANLYRRVDPDTDLTVSSFREGMGAFVREWERGFGPAPKPMHDRWIENDARALAAVWIAPDQPSTVVDRLDTISTPTLIYAGGDDHMIADIVRPSQELPDAELVVIDGLNHMETFYRRDLVVPHVLRFLERH